MNAGRVTYLVQKLTHAVEAANTMRALDNVARRPLSPATRVTREYAMAVKGRLLGHAGGQRPPAPWYARPEGFTPDGRVPFGDWDSAMVAYMRETGYPGFMNRAMRRSMFPRAQRIDGVW